MKSWIKGNIQSYVELRSHIEVRLEATLQMKLKNEIKNKVKFKHQFASSLKICFKKWNYIPMQSFSSSDRKTMPFLL